jgi:hypothetical protein
MCNSMMVLFVVDAGSSFDCEWSFCIQKATVEAPMYQMKQFDGLLIENFGKTNHRIHIIAAFLRRVVFQIHSSNFVVVPHQN